MALCSSLVRKMGGSMSVSSDHGRGTTVSVLIPVKSLAEDDVDRSPNPSSADELVYFHRFDGLGLQRLAGSISSQLATFANVYTTTRIEEADYLLLPEEVCYGDQNDDLEQLLDHAKEGIKIGVLQAHKDAKIDLTAKNKGAAAPIYVTRKPFGPRSFSRLIQVANKTVEEVEEDAGRLDNEEYLEPSSRRPSQSVEGTQRRRESSANRTLDLIVTTDQSDEVLRSTPPAARVIKALSEVNLAGDSSEMPATFTALCVEDNALNMRILTRLMSQCNVAYVTAVDGVEAVEQYERHKPALVLLDINMPRKDGYEACKQMRSIEGIQSHIMAVTALGDDYSRRKGLGECKMDEWLTKPLDIGKFKARVKSLRDSFESKTQS